MKVLVSSFCLVFLLQFLGATIAETKYETVILLVEQQSCLFVLQTLWLLGVGRFQFFGLFPAVIPGESFDGLLC